MNTSAGFRLPDDLKIRHELRPGDLGRLIALHGQVYADEPGFGPEFEAFVARTVAEYGLDNRFRGRVWLLERGDELVGCAAIAHRGGGRAQLRWVLLARAVRGTGLGRHLVETALGYCRSKGYGEVYLETTDGLEASTGLYRKLGFDHVSSEPVPLWAGVRPLMRMRKIL
ncbi:MAG: GNAT family N-acetyltransferase [Wenzhouxiangellaceae bacterium]|nr:GNAT family N-acetyltransferase [Wenzhouxiangellaceae bacterium]